MKPLTFIALAASVAGIAGCAGGMYAQPYALFESESYSPTEDLRPAEVVEVDGRSTSIARNDPIPPGKHTIKLSVPGPPGMSDPGRTTLEVDAKGCTRYLFAARRTSRTARDWEGFLVRTEPIGECVRKFEK
jgi:hypothetical protein